MTDAPAPRPADELFPPARDRWAALCRWLGGLVILLSFLLGCLLVAAEMVVGQDNPYAAIITYTLTPTGIGVGVALLVVGWFLERRRHHADRLPMPLPILNLNNPATRSIISGVTVGLVLFLVASAFAGYRGYHFMESNEFCGEVCHKVMTPEYKAHQKSPHAKVDCVACHIGPGAEGFVKAKLNGMNQLYGVLTNTYHLPIKTPVKQLRPAKDICEQCHFPRRMTPPQHKTLYRYSYDRFNTPSRFDLLMKVGGVNPMTGKVEGIHWHAQSDSSVYFFARDEKRMDIPWVEVRRPDGTRTVYSDGSVTERPPEDKLRRMDCLDCHNRPAHQMLPPNTLVDLALAEGELDRNLPYIKRNSVAILSMPFESTEDASQKIRQEIENRYPVGTDGITPDAQKNASDFLIMLYQRYNFPEQKANWRAFPMHLGHRVTPGCARCHDGKHKAEDGKLITRECSPCHEFLRQSHGDEAYGNIPYASRDFEHPVGEVARYDKEQLCHDCHAPEAELSPAK